MSLDTVHLWCKRQLPFWSEPTSLIAWYQGETDRHPHGAIAAAREFLPFVDDRRCKGTPYGA